MNDTDLVFDYLELSGFMSFPPKKKQKLILNTNCLTTIIGENLDVGNGERNGVGKSALIDAILYLYFGKSPRVSNQGFLNYVDPGPMFVSGTASRSGIAFLVERGENPSVLRLFEKPVSDIRDWREKNEKGKYLFETTKSSKPETTKRVIDLIGFDIKLSDVLLVNNPADRSCFFLKTEEEQRNIIERIFGFTVLTEKANHLRELRKEENKNLSTKESALIATRQANDRVLREIILLEEKSNTLVVERDKIVRFLTHQIRSYDKINFEHELIVLKEINTINENISQIERDGATHQKAHEAAIRRQDIWWSQHHTNVENIKITIKTLSETDATADIKIIKKRDIVSKTILDKKLERQSFKQESDNAKQQLQIENTNRNLFINQVEAVEKQIIALNDSKCPTCGQDWEDNAKHITHCIIDLDKYTSQFQETDDRIKILKLTIETAERNYTTISNTIQILTDELANLNPVTFETIEEANLASTRLEELTTRLKTEENTINPHTESVKELETNINSCIERIRVLREEKLAKPQTQYNDFQTAVYAKQEYDTIIAQFEELQKTENPYRETIDNLRTNALKIVDEKEVKALKTEIEHMSLLITLLSDRDSPIRKSMMFEWLPELNSRINSGLQFLELPHTIVFDPNMTATFTLNKKELGFGNLSTGQRLRVWLATNRAFREIFEQINYNINLFFVDEVLDKGMSARGADVSYNLLEQMVKQNKSVFLISHRSELVDISDHTINVILENGLTTLLQ